MPSTMVEYTVDDDNLLHLLTLPNTSTLLSSILLCCALLWHLTGPASAVALATIFAVGVVVSTAGSNNGSIMTGGRAFYAVARGKCQSHCRLQTPQTIHFHERTP